VSHISRRQSSVLPHGPVTDGDSAITKDLASHPCRADAGTLFLNVDNCIAIAALHNRLADRRAGDVRV
jgi:hypothetical protein